MMSGVNQCACNALLSSGEVLLVRAVQVFQALEGVLRVRGLVKGGCVTLMV